MGWCYIAACISLAGVGMKGVGGMGNVVFLLVLMCAAHAEAASLQRIESAAMQRGVSSRTEMAITPVRADTRLQLTKAETLVKNATAAIKRKDFQLAMDGIRAAKALVYSVEGSGVASTELSNALAGAESAISSGGEESAMAQCRLALE